MTNSPTKKSSTRKKPFTHVKVSQSFVDHLQKHQLYRNTPKAILGALRFLNTLYKSWINSNRQPVEFYHKSIKDFFHTYDPKVSYVYYRIALVSLGLIKIDWEYTQAKPLIGQVGSCRKYKITPLCESLLDDANLQYFHKIFGGDKKESIQSTKRRNKNKKSRLNNISSPLYTYAGEKVDIDSHPTQTFLEYLTDLQLNLTVDSRIIKRIQGDWTETSEVSALVDIKECRFDALQYNEKDNRVWNSVVALKSCYRPGLRYKNLPYRFTIDLRAAHPTFLGLYIKDFLSGPSQDPTLETECFKWGSMVQDDSKDFRKELGKNGKSRLNSWINSRPDEGIEKWMGENYPTMLKKLNGLTMEQRKLVGCNISKHYETKIFQDLRLYKKGEDRGMKLGYEYDGLSIFCSLDVGIEKVQEIVDLIKTISNELFGMKVVVVVEDKTFKDKYSESIDTTDLVNRARTISTLTPGTKLFNTAKQFQRLLEREAKPRKRFHAISSHIKKGIDVDQSDFEDLIEAKNEWVYWKELVEKYYRENKSLLDKISTGVTLT